MANLDTPQNINTEQNRNSMSSDRNVLSVDKLPRRCIDLTDFESGDFIVKRPVRLEKGKGILWEAECKNCGAKRQAPAKRFDGITVVKCRVCLSKKVKEKSDTLIKNKKNKYKRAFSSLSSKVTPEIEFWLNQKVKLDDVPEAKEIFIELLERRAKYGKRITPYIIAEAIEVALREYDLAENPDFFWLIDFFDSTINQMLEN